MAQLNKLWQIQRILSQIKYMVQNKQQCVGTTRPLVNAKKQEHCHQKTKWLNDKASIIMIFYLQKQNVITNNCYRISLPIPGSC